MKKITLFLLVLSSLTYANNTTLSYEYGVKDYKNSMTKKDGNVKTVGISHKVSNHKIDLSYQGDNVIRKHSISNVNLKSLDVEKYSIKYNYKINDTFSLKTSYIKIIDNLAPTDQGKVYGLGGAFQLSKVLSSSLSAYKSDYQDFDVKQYDFAISKSFKIDSLKLRATALAKKIDINGNAYGNYLFKDKDYFTTGIKLAANYQGYVAGVGTFFGERIFTVLDGGTKVQHHAMQQDRTYMLSFGKKFKDFDIIAKYSFQNGKELPENRDDVDTKVMAVALIYKF